MDEREKMIEELNSYCRERGDNCESCAIHNDKIGNRMCANITTFDDLYLGQLAYLCNIISPNKVGCVDGKVILDSGDRTAFPTGAVRDMHEGKGRMDLLPWLAILEVSKHCEKGAKKYGEHNVDKGIPVHSLMDSGIRHAAKFIIGQTDEDHLVAACWNLLWALEMQLIGDEELCDIPWYEKQFREENRCGNG